MCMCKYVHLYAYMYMSMYMYVCVHVCMCACMYVCMRRVNAVCCWCVCRWVPFATTVCMRWWRIFSRSGPTNATSSTAQPLPLFHPHR